MSRETMFSWLTRPLSEVFGTPAVPPTAPSSLPLERPVLGALEQLHHTLDLLRGTPEEAALAGEPEEQRKARSRADHEEAERLEAALHRSEMQEDVLDLHLRLRTGIDADELLRLRETSQRRLEEARRKLAEDDRAAQVITAIVAGLYVRVGEEAWSDLRRRMDVAGERWPDPSGLPPHGDPGEIARAREMYEQQARTDFIATRGQHALERMFGNVPQWRAAYPLRGSSLWRETALRGVGAALRMRMFERVIDAAQAATPELRQGLAELLKEKLSEVNDLLARGVTSILEADRISRETDRVVNETAPDYVWQAVRHVLAEPAVAPSR